MCCLKYEQDAYEDLLRNSPKVDSFVDTPEGRGTIVEVNLLRQKVKVRMEDSPETIGVFPNADIAVLRSGKAKKNDPPIPMDLAPISGNGKRKRKEEPEEEKLTLDPIRFRYREEAVVEEPVVQETPAEEPAEPKPSRRRRKKSGSGEPKQEKQEAAAPAEPKAHKEPAKKEKKDSEGEAETKKPHRRPHHRRRKPKPAGEG
jgi:hypothetical protein